MNVAVRPTIVKRAVDELKEFLFVAVYLYICFAALTYSKAAILHAHEIAFTPFGFAAVKALICAKFLVLGRALHLGERYVGQALIWPTLYRSLVFAVLIVALNFLEEIIVGYIHHRSIADTVAEFDGGTLGQVIATSVVMLLVLIPFFAFQSLGEALSDRYLFRLFFEPRRQTE